MIIKKGGYECDAGSLKIGNKDFQVLVSNGIGDGGYEWYVVDSDEDLPKDAHLEQCIQGKHIKIFCYDCDDYTYGYELNGSYFVYSHHGYMYLRYWSDTYWWGGNE